MKTRLGVPIVVAVVGIGLVPSLSSAQEWCRICDYESENPCVWSLSSGAASCSQPAPGECHLSGDCTISFLVPPAGAPEWFQETLEPLAERVVRVMLPQESHAELRPEVLTFPRVRLVLARRECDVVGTAGPPVGRTAQVPESVDLGRR